MKNFHLERTIDDSNVSGVGQVAQGTVFDNGKVVMTWLTGISNSVTVYDSIQELEMVHGHGGHTLVVMEDNK